MAAFQAWTLDKSKSLADHLEARGDLTGAKRALLEGLAEVHLEAHGGDIEKSLAAVPANRSTRAGLAELGDPEIEAALARVTRSKIGHATEPFDDVIGPLVGGLGLLQDRLVDRMAGKQGGRSPPGRRARRP